MTNIKNIISKHQTTVANFDFEEKEREFKKLADLQQNVAYTILAVFINKKGKFGDQGVMVTDDFQVNLPPHLLELSQDLRQDEDVIQAINNRELAFETYSYKTNEGREGYSINLTPSTDAKQDDSKGRAFNNDDSPAF